jgi:hypothetical protein
MNGQYAGWPDFSILLPIRRGRGMSDSTKAGSDIRTVSLADEIIDLVGEYYTEREEKQEAAS